MTIHIDVMNQTFAILCAAAQYIVFTNFQSQALIIQESYNQSGVKSCFSSKETQLNVIG